VWISCGGGDDNANDSVSCDVANNGNGTNVTGGGMAHIMVVVMMVQMIVTDSTNDSDGGNEGTNGFADDLDRAHLNHTLDSSGECTGMTSRFRVIYNKSTKNDYVMDISG
jgi:hypothetical protein